MFANTSNDTCREQRNAASGHKLFLRAAEGAMPFSRAEFLACAAASCVALVAGASPAPHLGPEQPPAKGKQDGKVHRWAVVTLGNLSRNRYWGESDAKAVRSAICTCTLIEGAGFRLLVDPSLQNLNEMARALDRRTGLRPTDVSAVFIPHEHADHYAGLDHFPQARWLASPAVAGLLNATQKWPKLVEAVSDKIFDALDIVPTPGH